MKYKVALILALSVFAGYNNQAEPERPGPTPAFYVTMAPKESNREIIVEVENMSAERDEYERELLAKCVEAEAGNQSELGKRLVVDVILNRVEDPRFPDNIKDVILQPGQFAVVENGMIYTVKPSQETYTAILKEAEHRTEPDVLYFNAGGYPEYGEKYTRVEGHYFSK